MISVWFVALLAGAQTGDARWTPFLGCWNLVEDQVRQPVVDDAVEDSIEEDRPMGLMCLAPEGNSVRLQTFSGDEAFLEETLSADGQKHPLTQGKCSGWQELEWSKDGSFLFLRSELLCGEGRTRSITGVSMLTDASTWVEIQSIGDGRGRAVLVRRFRAASDEVTRLRVPSLSDEEIRSAVEARFASKSMILEDVIEASTHVDPEVVEAMLVERVARFPLDSKTLLQLSDAAVPPRVIDLMVALSFPLEFAIVRETGGGGGGIGFGYAGYDPFYDYGFAYPYYFAPFGYYYGYYPWTPIYIPPDGTPDGGAVGRAVEGFGYTRVTRATTPDSGGRRAHRRGESGSGGSDWSTGSSSGSSEGGSSTGGSVSRDGYSRGGGGDGGAAKPKKQ